MYEMSQIQFGLLKRNRLMSWD